MIDALRLWLTGMVTVDAALPWAKAAVLVVLGFVLARALKALVGRLSRERLSAQYLMILQRAAYWTTLLLALASALRELGFDLSVLLGAAGVLTVAVGFASQTSASNLISGLFLLAERPFVLGDIIRVGSTVTGEVVSVDLLSVKLRTFDNLFVRVPNETLLRSEITNLTHYPIRRIDLRLTVGHDVPLERAKRVLVDLADAHPKVLDEPRPNVFFQDFSADGQVVQLSAWTSSQGFVEVKNQLAERVRAGLMDADIALLVPQRPLTVLGAAPGSDPTAAPKK